MNTSPLREQWQDSNIDQETRYWLDEDSKYFLHQSLSSPCLNVVEGCSGSQLTDLQGRTFLDFHGNNVHQVGFGHPKVIQAITEQMAKLSFSPRRYTNKTAIALAQRLTAIAPGGLDKVLFAPGGAEAIGMALKLARMVTGRHKTISMWDSFHGASLDAISLGGEKIFRHNIGPLLPGAEHVPPANPYRCIWGFEGQCNLKCAEYIEYIIEREGDVAAVVAETIRASAVFPPQDYWQKVREICDRHGVMLILDEIPHAFGRTGTMFTCENYGIVPDILVVGKGLGGGIFPLAAMLTHSRYDIAGDFALGHYTHEKNPVAAAAALAMLDVIDSENLLNHVRDLGQQALQRLTAMQAQYPVIGDVRGMGLFLGLELVQDRKTKAKADDMAEKIMYCAMSKGLSFKTTMGNILTLTPPLNISESEMNQALNILESCFREMA
jgi:4-aminobutyrate aminotransferase